MTTTILMAVQQTDNFLGYIFGATIALFLLGYLFYSLVKPEKF
ncbi:MAG TPA: K(+)-transporting ATPase subunit F [Petrimonas sp.]|nr:K(+)-transporting ATPase subunit F [Petrimonas sp.]